MFDILVGYIEIHSGTKLSIFIAVASWAPENNKFSCPSKILGVQKLNLSMKYSKFNLPFVLLSETFQATRPNFSVRGLQ